MKMLKMQGCGNDFLIYDCMSGNAPPFRAPEIVHLCDRNFGIGADGVVILERGHQTNSRWTFYNSDGSEAEMCGNAARCAVLYLYEHHFSSANIISLDTLAGIIKGKVLESSVVEIALFPKEKIKADIVEKVIRLENGTALRVQYINTGVPHAVVGVDDIFNYPIDTVGHTLLKHPAFQPAETNVTFFQQILGNQIYSTTYERGVEKETMACGTGAVAAALVYSQLFFQPLPIEVKVPGGSLEVDLSPYSEMILLRGEAGYVMECDMAEPSRDFVLKTTFGKSKRGTP